MHLPEIVDRSEFDRANTALVQREKEATRARDALAADRRRQPMVEFDTGYAFDGPGGEGGFLDLFEGRSQLLLYHFWFPADGDPCHGCTMFADQIGHPAHINARDTTIALCSTAPQERIRAFAERMEWRVPWYTVLDPAFQEACRTTEYFRLQAFLRDGDRVFLTYETNGRGVEALGSVWTFLDLTPFGRQETWEDSPAGRPQSPPYAWWRYHDSYGAAG